MCFVYLFPLQIYLYKLNYYKTNVLILLSNIKYATENVNSEFSDMVDGTYHSVGDKVGRWWYLK